MGTLSIKICDRCNRRVWEHTAITMQDKDKDDVCDRSTINFVDLCPRCTKTFLESFLAGKNVSKVTGKTFREKALQDLTDEEFR